MNPRPKRRRETCEITHCLEEPVEVVVHPQHGEMHVCGRHSRNIRRLNAEEVSG